jgi:gamma-glutamyl:cysteine ligase YbdK (ATP-grasp superfamily)
LFEGYGIELEYMIVDSEELSVLPIADQLLKQVGGGYEMEVELGEVAWSNELALHVIELKTNGPSPTLGGLGALFQEHVARVSALLAPLGARLLPTAMHPWMKPESELRLWPHENDTIYNTFDRIFDCRGHGWANLQSTHINLPFANDSEFARLHAAIRVLLPLLPALAASSPYMDGKKSAYLDARLETYRTNSRRVPSVAGVVIPERVFSQQEYEEQLLGRIYRDLAPHDPEGVLRHEWVNARGCIARFDRMALEIRVLDVQECPKADIAIAAAVSGVVRALVDETWSSSSAQQAWGEETLAVLMGQVIRDADQAVLDNAAFTKLFGYPERGPVRVGDLWQHLIANTVSRDPLYAEWSPALSVILSEGSLARRIVRALGDAPSTAELLEVYARLADCLQEGELFRAGP